MTNDDGQKRQASEDRQRGIFILAITMGVGLIAYLVIQAADVFA